MSESDSSDVGAAMTGREMCEYIADVWRRRDGRVVNPSDIWEMSPTGELWPVYEAYEDAKAWDEAQR